MGSQNRSSLERYPEGIGSQWQRLLEAHAALEPAGCVVTNLAGVFVGTGSKGPFRLAGEYPGRELCSRQKGGDGIGKTKRGKGTKWMVVVDGQGIPLGSHLTSASPGEVLLAETTLAAISVPRNGPGRPQKRPLRIIADKGYDSDPLRWRLLQRQMLLISPHRKNRKTRSLNDGRTLRRYRKRWKIERTFAWLGNFRRLVVRYDRTLAMYQTFFHMACALITLRFVLK